mgnify:CR=1 FL=1
MTEFLSCAAGAGGFNDDMTTGFNDLAGDFAALNERFGLATARGHRAELQELIESNGLTLGHGAQGLTPNGAGGRGLSDVMVRRQG